MGHPVRMNLTTQSSEAKILTIAPLQVLKICLQRVDEPYKNELIKPELVSPLKKKE